MGLVPRGLVPCASSIVTTGTSHVTEVAILCVQRKECGIQRWQISRCAQVTAFVY